MGLLRLLLFAGVGYILYRYLLGKIGDYQSRQTPQGVGSRDQQQAVDVLVEDPFCHTYILQQGAESCTIAGNTYYFCSPECRKKFQSETRSQ